MAWSPATPRPARADGAAVSRRALFLGLAAAPVAWAAGVEGPDLFWVPGEGPAGGWSGFTRHVAAGTAAGLDFAIEVGWPVFPMATGRVVEAREDAVSGRYVIVEHGLWRTRYAHLDGITVPVGAPVTRADRIGRAGGTGFGAILGPHLHVDVHADAFVLVFAPDLGPPRDGPTVWLDPLRFAVRDAADTNGNATLPYWRGEQLDAADQAARASVMRALAQLRARVGAATNAELYTCLGEGALPPDLAAASVAGLLESAVAIRPRLTAPLR